MTETVDEDDVLDVMAEDDNIDDDEDDEDRHEDVEEEREVSEFWRLCLLNQEVSHFLIV